MEMPSGLYLNDIQSILGKYYEGGMLESKPVTYKLGSCGKAGHLLTKSSVVQS